MGNGTGIGRVRGLGSAKHGSKHWIDQRLTAIGNLLLTSWLVLSLLVLPNMEHETVAGSECGQARRRPFSATVRQTTSGSIVDLDGIGHAAFAGKLQK